MDDGNKPWLSRSLTGLPMGPSARNGAELQFAFAAIQTAEFMSLNLVFQISSGLEQRGFQRVVPGLGMQGWAVDQQRRLARTAGGLKVQARSRNLQPHLDAEGRVGIPLVFEDYLGRGDSRQAMQVLELFLHLTVPGGLGV